MYYAFNLEYFIWGVDLQGVKIGRFKSTLQEATYLESEPNLGPIETFTLHAT